MKLYRIKNWEKVYENNRTRELKQLAWVPIPNNHDGDGYTLLVGRENGGAFLGGWVALVQVASKCDPRGTLLRRSGIPHDPASLSRITRLPEKLFVDVLKVAEEECKWLKSEELHDKLKIPQDGAGLPHEDAPRARARTEGNGMEQKGEGNPPDRKQNGHLTDAQLVALDKQFKRASDRLKELKRLTPFSKDDPRLAELRSLKDEVPKLEARLTAAIP